MPGREADRDNLQVAAAALQALGCPSLHVLYELRDGCDPVRQDEPAAERLALAAAAVPPEAVVPVEALSRIEGCSLRTSADVVRVLDRVGSADVRMLCDDAAALAQADLGLSITWRSTARTRSR